jgi:predicted  nucleic acid-binding Zn-ribbon protein
MTEDGWPEQPPILFLVQKLINRSNLCPGESFCSNVDTVVCRNCGEAWKPKNMRKIGECPHCGIRKYQKQRCNSCELTKLDESIAESKFGGLLHNAKILDLALQFNVTVTLDEITPIEFQLLELIRTERSKQEEQEAKARAAAAAGQNSVRSFDTIEE